MNTTPRQSNALRIISLILVLGMVVTFLIGAVQLLTAGLYLMGGNTSAALIEVLRALLLFASTYILSLVAGFIFSGKWNWRGISMVLEKKKK